MRVIEEERMFEDIVGVLAEATARIVAVLRHAALHPIQQIARKLLGILFATRFKERVEDEEELVSVICPVARNPARAMAIGDGLSEGQRLLVKVICRLAGHKLGQQANAIAERSAKDAAEDAIHEQRTILDRTRGYCDGRDSRDSVGAIEGLGELFTMDCSMRSSVDLCLDIIKNNRLVLASKLTELAHSAIHQSNRDEGIVLILDGVPLEGNDANVRQLEETARHPTEQIGEQVHLA